MFHTLVKVFNEESAIGSLFPPHPAPCHLAVSCVRHLLQMIPTMIRSSHLNAVCHSTCVCVVLYHTCTIGTVHSVAANLVLSSFPSISLTTFPPISHLYKTLSYFTNV